MYALTSENEQRLPILLKEGPKLIYIYGTLGGSVKQ